MKCSRNSIISGSTLFAKTKQSSGTELHCDFESLTRDQARVRLGRNIRPRGRNFAVNGTQGEVGVSLKKKKKKNFFFFF